jgi:hypothetical protein
MSTLRSIHAVYGKANYVRIVFLRFPLANLG